MKKELQEKILELRKMGMGYKAIAKELSLTPSAVRCVCTSKYNDLTQYGSCKCCGIRIKYTPNKKKRVFCSDKCRMRWWNSHQEEINRKAYYKFECPCCGKEFVAYGKNNRIYCSIDCYVKARMKKEEKTNESE